MRPFTKGFTLIELLVVIAIIALLSSVVLVALGDSRKKAVDTSIRSDLNQAGAGMELYINTKSTGNSDYGPVYASGSCPSPGDPSVFGSYAQVVASLAAVNAIDGGNTKCAA